jgi:hypothetical protein
MTQGLREPRVSNERNLHQGTDASGDGIDTDARDDAKSAGHTTLPLSSAALGDYSHLTATRTKKMTMILVL